MTIIGLDPLVIMETRKYINDISFIGKRRKYNIALFKVLKTPQTTYLDKIKKKIFEYISKNENRLDNIEKYLNEITIFNNDFDSSFNDDMKVVEYIMIYNFCALGGDL